MIEFKGRNISRITIYGASDDLVEIEGDLREEFPIPADEGFIFFDTGLIVKYEFGHHWQFSVVKEPQHGGLYILSGDYDDDKTLVIESTTAPTWAGIGTQFVDAKGLHQAS